MTAMENSKTETEYARFESALRKILTVPKDSVKQKQGKAKRKKPKKKRP